MRRDKNDADGEREICEESASKMGTLFSLCKSLLAPSLTQKRTLTFGYKMKERMKRRKSLFLFGVISLPLLFKSTWR